MITLVLLRRRRRWRPWSILAVCLVNDRSHLLETLPFVHHLHHVTRDVNADASAKTHSIEYRLFRRRVVLKITGGIARVPLLAATAITRNVTKCISVGDGESISLPYFQRCLMNISR